MLKNFYSFLITLQSQTHFRVELQYIMTIAEVGTLNFYFDEVTHNTIVDQCCNKA